jgi:maleate isomerase
MSGITFLGGTKAADRFVRQVEEVAGVGISIGSHAASAALRAYGGVSRLAILSPYWPVMNEEVKRYFNEAGFQVVRDLALQVTSWTGIAAVTPAQCRKALQRLDGDDIDAIVQVGTNLSMLRLAAAAELWLGKPVVAINAATYWHALRSNDIRDPIAGFGRLLEEF